MLKASFTLKQKCVILLSTRAIEFVIENCETKRYRVNEAFLRMDQGTFSQIIFDFGVSFAESAECEK